MTMRMSSGLTEPRLARLSVRTSVIVMTMVTSTTSVAPKLRASSLRRDEWNNIARSTKTRDEDYGLPTQDPGCGGCGTRKMRRARPRGSGGLQARPGPAVQAGGRRAQGRRPRDEARQDAARVQAGRCREPARDHGR